MEDMGSGSSVVFLADLAVGVCTKDILVKVDRMIFKEMVRCPLGRHRPMVEQDGIHVVVFDEKNTRALIVFDDRTIICAYAHMFAEQRSFRIQNFDVLASVPNNHLTLHIRLRLNTVVVGMQSSMPRHCFHLLTVPHINTECLTESGLVDVCGFLVEIYESGLVGVDGILRNEVTLVLEDNGVLSIGGRRVLVCRLVGSSADYAMMGYEAIEDVHDPIFVVVQYARSIRTPEGEPALISYYNATRVFYNPSFPEILDQRLAMLGRVAPVQNSSFLPLL